MRKESDNFAWNEEKSYEIKKGPFKIFLRKNSIDTYNHLCDRQRTK